jgi:uncharacterized radical SAM protein YgiQ
MGMLDFLPMTAEEMTKKGWSSIDVLLITGDAYVDHPSYGAAVIGRVLESHGLRVGIVAQPDWRSPADFLRLGRPRLFVGITAGNLDSMVSNYTSHKKPRVRDGFSPEGKAGLRPDRATIVYANRVREVFGDIPVVIGGIEASMRRLAHYDWWDNRVRRSLLLDSRADILVYGMGEKQIVEIADRIAREENLAGIRGTVVVRKGSFSVPEAVEIPSFEDVTENKEAFSDAFLSILKNSDPFRGHTLTQRHGNRLVVQYPPPAPFTEAVLDAIYGLPFARQPHSVYAKTPVPGFETVKFSIISHRGCCGGCSFCSLSMHQGRIVQSRSTASVLKEAQQLTQMKEFRGTITDIGGPTVNLYKASCRRWSVTGTCETRDCLMPEKCAMLQLGYNDALKLYEAVRHLPGVKNVFLESGLRYDLLVADGAKTYLDALCRHHVGGRMKVAPEHRSPSVLKLMNKPNFDVYERFVKRFGEASRKAGKDQYLVNYFISSHPGATIQDEEELSRYLRRRGMRPEQIQDFTPLPMTLATCLYYTEKDPATGEKIHVAKTFTERKLHRATIQREPSVGAVERKRRGSHSVHVDPGRDGRDHDKSPARKGHTGVQNKRKNKR